MAVPMIPCGLCERWFHPECLDLPQGSPAPCIRGLYFCQDCLTDLRELRRLVRPQRHLEARVQVLEAAQEALDAGHALLKEAVRRQCPGNMLDDSLVVRTDSDQLVSSAYAALLAERAKLKRDWAEVISGDIAVQRESGRASGSPPSASRNRKRAPVRQEKRYECHLCSFRSARWINLCAHLKEQHGQRVVYNCSVCRQQFHLFQRFRQHRAAGNGCRKASFRKTYVRVEVGSEVNDVSSAPTEMKETGSGSEKVDSTGDWSSVVADERTAGPVQRESGRASAAGLAAPKARKRASSGPVPDGAPVRKSKRYECHLCCFWSSRWVKMCRHLKEQHDRRVVYNCCVCRKQFLLFRRFRQHRIDSHGCRKASFSKTFVRVGSEDVVAAAPAAAPVAGPGLSSGKIETGSGVRMLGRTRNCPFCPATWSSIGQCNRHVKSRHKELWMKENPLCACRTCGRKFVLRGHLALHLRYGRCAR
jgi:hypothetical protein